MSTTAHIERVNAAGRNDVYVITLGCGCVVRHEPDAPKGYELELRERCSGFSPDTLIAVYKDAVDAFEGWDGK